MTTGSTNRKKAKPSKAARQAAPSEQSRAAAKTIRNTKAELLDTITAQHKTILIHHDALKICSEVHFADLRRWELDRARLKMIVILRRQLEKRLWDAVLELLALEERERGRREGYTYADMAPIERIRELFK